MTSIITKENYTVLEPGDKLSICWYVKTEEGYEGIKIGQGTVEDYSGSIGVRIESENCSVLLDPRGFEDDQFLNYGNETYLRFKLV